jgi:alpha-galactosidase
MAFYLKFERNGENLYPLIRQVLDEGPRAGLEPRALRDVQALGYFRHRVERALQRVCALVHQARPARLIEQFNIPLDEYIRRCEVQITGWEFMRQKLENPDSRSDARRFAAAMAQGRRAADHMPRVVSISST